MRNVLLILWALLISAPARCQSVRVERLKADVGFLASRPLEGRRALERGSDVAAEFIAAEFAKAGLRPGAGASFFQPVELLEYRPDPQATRLTLWWGGRKHECRYGRDFSGSFPRDLNLRAPLAFAGYGITAPEYGYDDYAGLDVTGKIALVFEYEPQLHDPSSPFNGEGNTLHASPRRKALNAQQHGAVALLVIPAPNRKRPFQPGRGGSAQALSDSEVRIPLFTLSPRLAEQLLSAAGRTPAELQRALDASLKPVRLELEARAELHCKTLQTRRGLTANVIGLLEGADPVLRQETVVFSAHYDHLGAREGKLLPGADDNASGTAGLLELARLFGAEPPPRRSLLFIAFGTEEAGLLGSYYYAAHPVRPLETTRALINLDMIGRDEQPSAQTAGLIQIASDTSNEVNLVGAFYSPDLRALLERENRPIGLRLGQKWDRDATLNILWRCDHFAFLMKQIPAVWLFNGFTPDYHAPADTADKLNFAKMEKIVRLAWRAGRALAEEPGGPRFGPARR